MNESISLIVTLYNRLEYARNMILSLLNQTKQIDELIFADDGSKEYVLEYIKDLLPRCKFKIKYVIQEDIGFRLARSRNNGARIAEGKFLIFMDQDVIFDQDFIEKIYNSRKKKRLIFSEALGSSEKERDMIQSILKQDEYNYQKIYSIMPIEKKKEQDQIVKKEKLYNVLYNLKLRTRGAKIVGLIFALYKEDFINLNGFDEKYIGWGEEDDDFGNRFFKYGGEVESIKYKRHPIHMFHPSSPSKKDLPNLAYYRQRKKEISKTNYRAEYGYDNILDKDEISIEMIKKKI